MNQNRAYTFAGVAIFFWSTVATAFKLGLQYMSPAILVLLSSITAFITLLIVAFARGQLHYLRELNSKDLLKSCILGLLSPFLYYLVLFKAYDLLPAQLAQPLNMVWPIVLVFLSVPILKQHIGWKSFLALFICFIGVLFISSNGSLFQFGNTNWFGVLLALGSSIIWSFYFLINLRDSKPEEIKLLLNFFFSSIYITFFCLFTGGIEWPVWEGFVSGIYIGLFEMGLTYLFWLKALRLSASTDKISSLVYLAPFVSLVFIHYVLGETIYMTTILGLVLIVAGILFQKFGSHLRKNRI